MSSLSLLPARSCSTIKWLVIGPVWCLERLPDGVELINMPRCSVAQRAMLTVLIVRLVNQGE